MTIFSTKRRANQQQGEGGEHQPDSNKSEVYQFKWPQTLLGQWLNFKLFGITYLVGNIKFKLFFSGSIG